MCAALSGEVEAKKALASEVSGEGESEGLLSAVLRAAACAWLRRSPRSFAAEGSRRPAPMLQSELVVSEGVTAHHWHRRWRFRLVSSHRHPTQ